MTTKKKPGHVFLSKTWPGTLCCFHCGDTYRVNMPVSLDLMGVIARAYGKEHKGCKESENGRGLRMWAEEAYKKFKEEKEDDSVPDQKDE